jgi:3-deoxy-D-manno-octulosonic-acid transferase
MTQLRRRILRSDTLRRILCWLISIYIRLVFATSRWTVEGAETPRRLHRAGRPFILAFWHGRLLMMPMAWQRDVPIHMLISSHRDGRIIADAVGHFGIASVDGSSSRGGGTALRRMVKALRQGDCVGITPDGPRGPAMEASLGIVATARLAQVPIVPLAYATRARRVLGTWDRFHLAFPFTRGIHIWGAPIEVPANADEAALETHRRLVEGRLNALGREADRRMGHHEESAEAAPALRDPLPEGKEKSSDAAAPFSLAIYRTAATWLGPAILLYLAMRRLRGKEDPARFGERLGRAGMARPRGPLVWLHAASVGEAASLLALIDRLTRERPSLNILVTTGTLTSARLLETRLPAGRALHQFVPVDRPSYVRRFLDHWQPDLAIWVESELWPNLISVAQERGIPTVLLNARMSRRSFERWHRRRGLIAPLLDRFALCLAQDEMQLERLRALGAVAAETVGDLKSAAAPLPVDAAELERLRAAVAERPLWLAANTHPGEEDAAIAVHVRLRAKHRGLLTIIVPRHPARGDAIAATLRRLGISVARRSRGEAITPSTEIYLGDTLGEMGLFYRLAEAVFVGGSLTPVGGHSPFEPAILGCAILHGPDMSNCAEVARALDESGGAIAVTDANALGAAIDRILADPGERRRVGDAALAVAKRESGVLDAVLSRLDPWLDMHAPRAARPDDDRACA